jgi:hypothetical protein
MLRILVSHGHEEQVFPAPQGEVSLGSAPENDIVLHVRGISRRHTLLRRCAGGIEILDQGSKNGLMVEGQRVDRAVLTPGLRVQVGAAWLEIEDISSSAEALAALASSSEEFLSLPVCTAIVEPKKDPRTLSCSDAALALAYHIVQRGAGFPGRRADLLARIKATLDAEAFASFEKRPRGKLRDLENGNDFLRAEVEVLSTMIRDVPSIGQEQAVVVKRAGRVLIAGRSLWFLGARFSEDSLAQESWRKDLLRFLAHRLFLPVRSLEEIDTAEAHRILALARGNKRRAAALLGVSPGTLYKLLGRAKLKR